MFKNIYKYSCDFPGCKQVLKLVGKEIENSEGSVLDLYGWSYKYTTLSEPSHFCPKHSPKNPAG